MSATTKIPAIAGKKFETSIVSQCAVIAVILGAAVSPSFFFPGDVPWINDEPLLFIKALKANAEGRLAVTGLRGSFGISYPPVIVWFYQVCLLASRDMFVITVFKITFSVILLYSAAIVLKRELTLSVWGLVVIACSPYVWFYNRILWDNVFLIPGSLWLIAITANHLNAPRGWKVCFLGGIACVLIHIHPIAAIPVIATGFTIVVARKDEFHNQWGWYLVTVAGFVLLCLPYLWILSRQEVIKAGIHGSDATTSWFATLTSVRIFSFWQFDSLYDVGDGAIGYLVCMWFTLLVAIGLLFVGLAVGSMAWRRVSKLKERPSARDWLFVSCVLMFLLQTAFFVSTRAYPFPHYFNAFWVAVLIPIWVGLTHLVNQGLRWHLLPCLYSFISFVLLFWLIGGIHSSGGSRTIYYGATLGNQISIARYMKCFSSDFTWRSDVPNLRKFPHAINALILIVTERRSEPRPDRKARRDLVISYVDPDDPRDGRLRVSEGAQSRAIE